MRMPRRDGRVYVGNLPPDATKSDVEDIFRKYGRILALDFRARDRHAFAFLEYESPSQAEGEFWRFFLTD